MRLLKRGTAPPTENGGGMENAPNPGKGKKAGGEIVLAAQIISPGIERGVVCPEEGSIAIPRYRIHKSAIDEEKTKLEEAVERARKTLVEHIRVAHDASEEDLESILQFHEMMLQDKNFFSRIQWHIEQGGKNAQWAVMDAATGLIDRFESMTDPYFRARSEDIRDLAETLLASLDEKEHGWQCNIDTDLPVILVSRNLYATSAAHARKVKAAGYVTESRALYSHGAILLKGMGIPVLGGAEGIHQLVHVGDEIIVDALKGKAVLRPSPPTLKKYAKIGEAWKTSSALPPVGPTRTKTAHGIPVRLFANIEHPSQIPFVIRSRLEGVGLFRTEFLVLEKNAVPDEEQQVAIYGSIFDQLQGRRVVIRTLDIGGDKQTSRLHRCVGQNPALGIRGIRRHILIRPEEILAQIRAILRAARGRDAHILFPMVTNLDDVRKAKQFVKEATDRLAGDNIPHAEEIKVGAMLEVPSLAFLLKDLFEEVDFVSVGTNDLFQYFTAADRDNPDVLFYQDPKGPSFQGLLRFIVEGARESGRLHDLTVCGEIASSPDLMPMLLELGFRSFSIAPVAADSLRSTIETFPGEPAPGTLQAEKTLP